MTKTQRAITKAIAQGNEVCICAAIMWRGRVWRGHRHGHAMEVMRQELGWNMTGKEIMRSHMFKNQGFVTSKNRYVGREEGLRLHKAAGIPSQAEQSEKGKPHAGYRNGLLFSEDLY